MVWHLAGSDRKHDLCIGIYSLGPEDTFEYLGCHYSTHISGIMKCWKSWFCGFFLAVFPWKNDFFIWSGRKCPESHYMAGNGYLRCRRHILHRYSISKHVLSKFREIRKNSIFEILKYGFSADLAENKQFPADNRPNNIGTRQDTPKTLSK